MNKVLCFEDLLVWQKAKEQVVSIYKIFRNCKDYSFRDQIQRAAISVMNNIAEGFERKTNNEFKYFLNISKGSNGELRSMLYAALDLNYIDMQNFEFLTPKSKEVSKMFFGLIKSLD